MKHRSVLFAALGASVILAAAAPAMADPDWGRHGYGDRGRGYADHGRYGHEGYERGWHGGYERHPHWAHGPRAYYAPPYYAQPQYAPSYYAQPYYAPPPVYYGAPGLTLRIR